jgi:hypothetical protein
LKAVLPVSAVAVAGVYALMILKSTGWGIGIPSLDIPTIVAENLAMENPHYEGFNKDGGRYWVTAKKAMQDIKNLSVINLDTITGELSDAEKKKTKLTAIRGTFNNKANILELFDSIDIAGDNGLKAHLTRATIRTKENVRPACRRHDGSRHDQRQPDDRAAENQRVRLYRQGTHIA